MKKNLTKLLLTSMLMGGGMLNAQAQTTRCQTPPFRTTITGNEWASGEMLSLNLGSTFAPDVEFHAKGSLLFHQLCSGSYIPNQNAGTYFYWDAFKGAIRAGQASSTGWNGVNVGTNSAAFGFETVASGLASFATGNTTTASGENSFSSGLITTASGERSFAANNKTVASGESSFAINTLTFATGSASFATGEGTTASGNYSASFGTGTVAMAINSFAMGYNTTASGVYSLSTGNQTSAQGLYSSSFGLSTVASGDASSAFGYMSNSSGEFSFSVNRKNVASGTCSFAGGYNNTASGLYSFCIGSNGTATGGNSFSSGDNSDATGDNSFSAGVNSDATGVASFSMGHTNNTSGNNSFSLGNDIRVTGDNSFGIGNSIVTPSSSNVFAMGTGINVPSHSCIFMGVNNTSNATPSLFIGDGTGQSSGNIGFNSLASANTKVTILGENTSSSFSAFAVRNTHATYADMFRILNSGQTIIGYTGSIPSSPAKLLVIADGNLPNNDAFQVQNWNGTFLSELMYINRNGNVGLEITNPASRLHSHIGTSNPIFHQFTNAGTGTTSADGFKIGLDPTANEAQLLQQENADMTFYTNASQQAVIKNTGEFGLGITAPTSKMHIRSTGSGSSTSALNVVDLANSSLLFVRDDGKVGMGITSPGSNLSVANNGTFGIGYATSAAPTGGLLVEGAVGIGNASPTAKVEITGGTAGTGSAALKVTDNASSTLLYVRDDGNVGFSTTTPANKFTLNGAASIGSSYTSTTAPTNGLIVEGQVGIGTSTIVGGSLVTIAGNVFPSVGNTYNLGDATNYWDLVYANGWGTISDFRRKENINPINYGLKEILKLKPVTYNLKNKTDQKRIGFIAQDLEQVISEVVIKSKDAEQYRAVHYDDLIPVLVKGIQEQQQLIEQQNERIAQLEERMKLQNEQQSTTTPSQQEQHLVLSDSPRLLQNDPNPFTGTTLIKYYLPANTTGAVIKVADMNGKLINTYTIKNTGYSQLEVKAGNVSQGAFTYTLEINGKVIDSKKMILIND